MTPCEAPIRSVKATISGRFPVPVSSRSRDGGRTPTAIRPTVMARSERPKTISTTRPPNWATPFIEATATAAPVARPAASSRGTSCTEITPNTNPLSDMMSAKSAMAAERAAALERRPIR